MTATAPERSDFDTPVVEIVVFSPPFLLGDLVEVVSGVHAGLVGTVEAYCLEDGEVSIVTQGGGMVSVRTDCARVALLKL